MTYLDLLEEHGGTSAPVLTGTLAVRTAEENPDHHLWNNRGTWWCHFTLHRPDYEFYDHGQSESHRKCGIQSGGM